MTRTQEEVLDAAQLLVKRLQILPWGMLPRDEAEALIQAVKAEEAECILPRSPIGLYVSEEDAEKFDRLLSNPFGRS